MPCRVSQERKKAAHRGRPVFGLEGSIAELPLDLQTVCRGSGAEERPVSAIREAGQVPHLRV